jgi:hypothetical protein
MNGRPRCACYPPALLAYLLSFRLQTLLMMFAVALATRLLARNIPRLGGRADLALAARVLLPGGRVLPPCQARQACHIEPKIAQKRRFGT